MDYPGIEDALKNKIGAIERIAAICYCNIYVKVHIIILRRPQNFAKSPPYFFDWHHIGQK